MSRSDRERVDDIRVACLAIADYLTLHTRESEPSIPWSEIARLRDHLAHRYFDTTHSILSTTARKDIPDLLEAAERLAARLAL